MTALEEIKSQLDVDMSKGITTVDRLRIIAGGVPDFDPITVEDAEWIISALEGLQAKNEGFLKRASSAEKRLRGANTAFERERKVHLQNQQLNRTLEARAEAAEAEVKRLRAALEPFAKYAGDPAHIKQRAFLQLLICPLGDDHPDNHVPYFQAAKAALASTGGEHNGN